MQKQIHQLQVSEIHVNLPSRDEDPQVLCYASIILNNCFRVNGLRLIERGDGKVILAMPTRVNRGGARSDVCHPIDNACREYLRSSIEMAFRQHVGWDGRRGVVA